MSVAATPAVVEPLLAAAGKPPELMAAIHSAVAKYGFDQFVFSRRNRLRSGIGTTWNCWGRFPPAWAALSRARNFAAVEPIRRHTFRTAVPLLWDQGTFGREAAVREYFAEAAHFGIRSGVSIAIFTSSPRYVDFFDVYAPAQSLSARRRDSVLRHLADLWAIGAYGRALLPPEVLRLRMRQAIGGRPDPRQKARIKAATRPQES